MFRDLSSKQKEAFSLVEIVFALAIMLFVISTLLGLMTSGVRNNSDSYESFIASSILTEICAELQNTPSKYYPTDTSEAVSLLKTANISLTAPFSNQIYSNYKEQYFFTWNPKKNIFEFSNKDTDFSNFRVEITYPEVSELKGLMNYRRIHVAVIWPPPVNAKGINPQSLRVESIVTCIGKSDE